MKKTNTFLKKKSLLARRQILSISYKSSSAHLSSCFSIVDILTFLYWEVLNINSKNPSMPDRDRFILSKGHAVAALYALLYQRKFINKKDFASYGFDGSKLLGHPEHTLPGVEYSTGSLGHGLSAGVGMALAAKLDKKKYKVFVLISDAECQEGSVWEAIMFASHHKLYNLFVIIDYNKLQAFGKTNEVLNLEPLLSKLKSFNWVVKETNGHNFQEIRKSIKYIKASSNPTIIIANTIGGKGVSFMENQLKWHYHNLDKNLYKIARKQLK